jgi:hypothetical protein
VNAGGFRPECEAGSRKAETQSALGEFIRRAYVLAQQGLIHSEPLEHKSGQVQRLI